MHPDLERLVRLQELDQRAEQLRRLVDELPGRLAEAEGRLAERADALASAEHRLAENQTRRRAVEKDLAQLQGRLSKFKDQLMEVKTNKEYQAMQKEIATAEREVRGFEDRLLEHMLEADELSALAKTAQQASADEQRRLEQERGTIATERAGLEREIEQLGRGRDAMGRALTPQVLARYEELARSRRGIAVVEVRDGHCGSCHVRLRPQAFNQIRQNESLIECESCQRILYYLPAPVTDASL